MTAKWQESKKYDSPALEEILMSCRYPKGMGFFLVRLKVLAWIGKRLGIPFKIAGMPFGAYPKFRDVNSVKAHGHSDFCHS